MERDLSLSFRFPPGFRFHPSDQELITHYLQNKVTSHPLPALVIAEIDLYKYNPWELPNKALFGEDEWYFFSPRDRKYPNGARPNRAAASGYWKATGTDKPILAFGGSKSIGVKKSLVFYAGRPPKGIKTDWIMNEYRLPEAAIRPSRLKGSMRLDDWVLCRVRQKGIMPKDAGENHERESSDLMRYSQTIEKDRPTFKYVSDTTTVDLYKDCQLMASLLAGYSVPAMDTISSISFQGSNKGASFNSGFSEGTDKLNFPNAVTSINNHVNALKRLHVEENRNDKPLIQPSKKQNQCSSDEDLLSKVLAESDLDQYNKVQYQDNIFNLQTSDSIIDFQELTDLAYSDRFIGQ